MSTHLDANQGTHNNNNNNDNNNNNRRNSNNNSNTTNNNSTKPSSTRSSFARIPVVVLEHRSSEVFVDDEDDIRVLPSPPPPREPATTKTTTTTTTPYFVYSPNPPERPVVVLATNTTTSTITTRNNNNDDQSKQIRHNSTSTSTMGGRTCHDWVRIVYNRFVCRYGAMKILGLLLAVYTTILSFTYRGTFGKYGGVLDRETGYIIDPNSEENTDAGVIFTTAGVERAVIATTTFQLIALAVARMSAFYMYPALLMVFLSKFRATMHFLSKTPWSMFTYEDLHDLHVFSGWTVLISAIVHTSFHIARYYDQDNLRLLWTHFSGVSGLIAMACLFLIALPMMWLKTIWSFELRKGLHYLFIVFCLAMCFHAPTSAFPNGGFATWGFTGVVLLWILDILYCNLIMSEKIESTIFHVVPTGVQLTMRVSDQFQKTGIRGGYCYVNFPWLSRYEWHAFSLFENPANPAERQIFMENVGDWTNKLHKTLQRDTSRPIWVQGPFSSPYDHADEYDNQILVAGGIGITPALSVMRANKTTRRTNLIWAVRDPHMLEFFLRRAEFSERGWNLIYYTGKEKTYLGDQSDIITSTGARVYIIKSRPNFDQLVPNLIYSIDSNVSMPEAYTPDAKIEAVQFLKDRLDELDRDGFLDNRDKIRALVQDAESMGYLFTDLVEDFFGEEASMTTVVANDGTVGTITDDTKRMNRDGGGPAAPAAAPPPTTVINEEHILTGLRQCEPGHSTRVFVQAPLPSLTDGLSSRNRRTSVQFERMMMMQQQSSPSPRLRESAASSALPSTRAWKAVTMAVDDWARDHAPAFKPWEADPTVSRAYVKSMDHEVLKSWGMLYCGGKSPLATNAIKAANDFGLEMHTESFAW